MAISTVTSADIRTALLLRHEIALLDVRHEAQFATAHPLFAANMAEGRITLEAAVRMSAGVRLEMAMLRMVRERETVYSRWLRTPVASARQLALRIHWRRA